jgi:general L-amino acid transport system permease protein
MALRPETSEFRPPPEPVAPSKRKPPRQWLKENLFRTWYDTVLTFVFGAFLAWILYRSFAFVFVNARWEIVEVNLLRFMTGRFPRDELWRPWLAMFVGAIALGLGAGAVARATAEEAMGRGVQVVRSRGENLRRMGPPLAFLAGMVYFVRTLPPVGLLAGTVLLGFMSFRMGLILPRRWRRWVNVVMVAGLVGAYLAITRAGGVPPANWGGLMLTMYFTVGAMVLCFPLGVLLALGRRSTLPAVRLVCIAYIEFFRGIPLIGLLVMSWLAFGFFVPPGATVPDRVTRALIAFVLFQSAYVAEIVRGGLPGVPPGQNEAAMAVGLPAWKMTSLVILPQALRSVIPALVGQGISLFKDTSLVFAIALGDLLRVAQTAPSDPAFLGRGLMAETLVFVSFIYWVGSYWMSRESQRLERSMGIGTR